VLLRASFEFDRTERCRARRPGSLGVRANGYRGTGPFNLKAAKRYTVVTLKLIRKTYFTIHCICFTSNAIVHCLGSGSVDGADRAAGTRSYTHARAAVAARSRAAQ
jgi:hypothetical protein